MLKLFAASYTAFDRAGRDLGVDATQLATSLDLGALIRTAEDLLADAERMDKRLLAGQPDPGCGKGTVTRMRAALKSAGFGA
jgi:hypothetical protein